MQSFESGTTPPRSFHATYEGAHLSRIAYPLGGLGAGMICIEGNGAFGAVSLRHKPDLFNAPLMFAALKLCDHEEPARVLEGPVPENRVLGHHGAGTGHATATSGFPRMNTARFQAQFPFAKVEFEHSGMPLRCEITAWSPFVPGDSDASCLPVAVLEYGLKNETAAPVSGVFSFHAENFMKMGRTGASVAAADNGFILRQSGSADAPWNEGAFAVTVIDDPAEVDCAWFRGAWFDARSILWRRIESGKAEASSPHSETDAPGPGASVYVPFKVAAGKSRTIRLLLTWHVPLSDQCHEIEGGKIKNLPPDDCCGPYVYAPWYARRFDSIASITRHALEKWSQWREESEQFRACLAQSDVPAEVMEAVGANLTILKSPTVLRQQDGRLWGWEGCIENHGCCPGSCTHVWNYAQAIPHLFPDLERTLRDTEFGSNQRKDGHQTFRATLPVSNVQCDQDHSAADGQLGGIMKMYRDWRIHGSTDWLRQHWPQVRFSLDYCIQKWDPDETGVLREPQHNTYDIEFWGPNGMCMSFYLGALRAAVLMAEALGKESQRYERLYEEGRAFMETELFNGEYFIQKTQWTGLRAGDPTEVSALIHHTELHSEAKALLEAEGPKYQYGEGCLSDGVLGAWMAFVCGIGEILDPEKVRSHLLAVHRYNLRRDLSNHANPQRPGYAFGHEGGLLLCSWPRGGEPTLPFVYSNEVWTGIEYQVAAHLMHLGCVDEGLEIVRTARSRYDGRARNPFDEYECGHWYARALSSYSLIQAVSGIRYDAVTATVFIEPRVAGDFQALLCTESGYGLAGVRDGQPFVEVRRGGIEIENTVYTPADRG